MTSGLDSSSSITRKFYYEKLWDVCTLKPTFNVLAAALSLDIKYVIYYDENIMWVWLMGTYFLITHELKKITGKTTTQVRHQKLRQLSDLRVIEWADMMCFDSFFLAGIERLLL